MANKKDNTTIQVSKINAKRLIKGAGKDETYNSRLTERLDEYESEETADVDEIKTNIDED